MVLLSPRAMLVQLFVAVAVALAVALVLMPYSGCSSDILQPLPVGPTNGWHVLHPAPVGYDLRSVWAHSPEDVWAVGDYGTIVHWDGQTERQVDSPTGKDLMGIDGSGPDDIYAMSQHTVLHYDGHTWETQFSFPDDFLVNILCTTSDHRLYISGTMGVQAWSAGSWQPVFGPSQQSGALWVSSDGKVRCGDLGTIWRLEGLKAIKEFEFDAGVISMGDGDFLVLQSDDDEPSTIQQRDSQNDWSQIAAIQRGIRSLLDGGGYPVWATYWEIAQPYGNLYDYSDGRWLEDLALDTAGHIYACGYSGTLVRSDLQPSGQYLWTESANDPGFHALEDFDGQSSADFWAIGYYGCVLHFTAGVWDLEYLALSVQEHAHSLQVLADDTVICCTDSTLVRRLSKHTWIKYPGQASKYLSFKAFSLDSIVASDQNGAYLVTHLGRNQVYSGPTIKSMARTPSGTLYGLTRGDPSYLVRWNGAGFDNVLVLPGISGEKITASRENDDVWLGGTALEGDYRIVLYRYHNGKLLDLTPDFVISPRILAMSELRPDDVFIMTGEKVWRCRHGCWTKEQGLPASDPYFTLWCTPDEQVFVEGLPTYSKDFSQE